MPRRRGRKSDRGRTGVGTPAAEDKGYMVEEIMDRGNRGKAAQGTAAGEGLGTGHLVNVPRDPGHVIGHAWPW